MSHPYQPFTSAHIQARTWVRTRVLPVAMGALLGIVGFLSATTAQAQEKVTVTGQVVSSQTGEPVADTVIIVEETGDTAVSDGAGNYTVVLAPGTYTMLTEVIGFLPYRGKITVATGTEAATNLPLEPDPAFSETIITVGTLGSNRTTLTTPVPVDVITSQVIAESSHTETNQVLATVAPSYNASHQAISDGTDHINPASLRGLGPDQVLILVNGKRRHSSALLNVNGTFGRGTVGTDLNSIPTSMIERIEVLRDGAAAQYGSDAISGVINIVLKDDVDTLDFTTMTGITGEGDGGQFKASANYGWPLREDGYVNVSLEMLLRDSTNRAGDYTGQIFPGVEDAAMTDALLEQRGLTREDFSMKIGQSSAIVGMLSMNAEIPLVGDWSLYTFGGLTRRNGYASGFYRLPFQEARVDLRVYPDGFLPEINPTLTDWSLAGGVRGNIAGFGTDLSVTHGGNAFHFFIENSINSSLGLSSPTDFDAGTLMFHQTTVNAAFTRPLELAQVKSLALVFGGELRGENYSIGAGEEASYVLGTETTSSGDPKTPGAQVFPGFQPDNEVDEWRRSVAAYAGVESQLTDRILLDIGGRFENFNDFGSTVIGKAAARFEAWNNKEAGQSVALRAAGSTGFRAPSLHQLWFSTVSTQFVGDPLEPAQVLTSNNADEVTKAFGIPELDEETSINVSAGITAKPMKNLSFTADFYRIQIQDRVVLTSRFASNCPDGAEPTSVGCQVADILGPLAMREEDPRVVSQAQFFANAVDTITNGVDLVADYGMKVGKGNLNLTASATFTRTEVDNVNIPNTVADRFAGGDLEAVRSLIFNREEQNRLEDALPRQKGTLGGKYRLGKLSASLRANYFGSVKFKPTNPENDETFGAKVILDTDVGYQLGPWRLSIGANNLLNTFPDKHENESNISSGRFVYSRRVSQFGVNGGFYYLRLNYLQ